MACKIMKIESLLACFVVVAVVSCAHGAEKDFLYPWIEQNKLVYLQESGKVAVRCDFNAATWDRVREKEISPAKDGFTTKTAAPIVISSQYSDGLARVFANGKWNFVDQTGKLLFAGWDAESDVGEFSDGRALIRGNGIPSFFINKSGKQAIDSKSFGPAASFSLGFQEGLAPVKINLNPTGPNDCGYIDTNGDLVIGPTKAQNVYGFFDGRA